MSSGNADVELDQDIPAASRCQCGQCEVMPTVAECICCCEIDRVTHKKDENEVAVSCITQHNGFDSVCLNVWVLQTAYYSYVQDYGDSGAPASPHKDDLGILGSPVDKDKATIQKVIFHVVIPVKFWDLNDSKFTLWIKLHGQRKFQCKRIRCVDDISEFICEADDVYFNPHEKVAYIYYRFDSQSENCQYEELHGSYRFIEKFIQGNEFHQYDSIAYPPTVLFGISFKKRLDHEGMKKAALNLYLEECKNSLSEEDVNAQVVTDKILRIYKSLYYSNLIKDKKFVSLQCEKLTEVMLKFLHEMTNKLFNTPIQNALMNGKRMLKAAIIVSCLHTLIDEAIPVELLEKLLKLFRLIPDVESEICQDWDIFATSMTESMKTTVSEAICRFINEMSRREKFHPSWLMAMPVAHFLTGASKPFQSIDLDDKKIQWTNEAINLTERRIQHQDAEWHKEKLFEDLQPLTKVDPLFHYGLVYVCPKNELEKLIPFILPFLSITLIANNLESYMTRKELSLITNLINKISETLRMASGIKADVKKVTLNSSLCLIQRAANIMKDTTQNDFKLLKSLFTLFLMCINLFDDLKSKDIKDSFKEAHKSLNNWMKSQWNNSFGASGWSKKDAMSEIEVWNDIIDVSIEREDVLIFWHRDIVVKIIHSRLKEVPKDRRIPLFQVMESMPPCHKIVANAIVDNLMEIMDVKDTNTKEVVEKLVSKGKSNIGKVMDRIIHRRYPEEPRVISLEDLLTWPTWQTLLRICGDEEKYKLTDGFLKLCDSAKNALSSIYTSIESGDITIDQFSAVKKNENYITKLLKNVLPELGMEMVPLKLKQRYEERKLYAEWLSHLKKLCDSIKIKIPVEGLDKLREDIGLDYGTLSIKSLWKQTNDKKVIKYLLPVSALPLNEIAFKFDIMVSSESVLFQVIWKKQMETASSSFEQDMEVKLTVQVIKTALWEEAFKECSKLLDSLNDRSIQLSEVEKYMRPIKENITSELEKLSTSVHECNSKVNKFNLRDVVQHINDFWSLLNLSEEARAVMELKKKLLLDDNFDSVMTLTNQELLTEPLSAIDDRLISAANFLEKLKNDSDELHSLEMFVESKIMKWIKLEIPNGINDLKKFVSVALHTESGQSDIANDKLSRLTIVGSVYCPLIYELSPESGFDKFIDCCTKVWDALEKTPTLSEDLIACNDDVEWYMKVKEFQASVEITSYNQMNEIMNYGCYEIGIKQPGICKSQSEVISLSLEVMKEEEERHLKTYYSLEDLQDLESKLVLITDNQKIVDLFSKTFHSVRRIAEVLINLQQCGNVNYICWVLQVPCSCDEGIIGNLRVQALRMEKELVSWNETVRLARNDFYNLNYYTTIQILKLRRELSSEKGDYSAIDPKVLFMLQSISRKIDPHEVREFVKNALKTTASNPFTSKFTSQSCTEGSHELKAKKIVTGISLNDNSDMPELSENELTDPQREILVFVTRSLCCSKYLVLKAFEEFQEKKIDKYDIRSWCFDNIYKFDFEEEVYSDIEEEDEDELEEPMSPGDNIDEIATSQKGPDVEEAPLPINSLDQNNIPTIQSTPVEYVDENHPYVQTLVSAGYLEERCITAVKKCRSLDAAKESLDHEEDEHLRKNPPPLVGDGKIQKLRSPIILADSKAEDRYLSLEQLGKVLEVLSQRLPGEVQHQRPFDFQFMKSGSPNLVVVEHEYVLKCTLSLYMKNSDLSLPTSEEVLLCCESTTAEEVELFWMRAINDPKFRRIFCLVHAEKLTYQVSDQALHSLLLLCQGKQDYRLVIICSNVGEEKSHFISKLFESRRPFTPNIVSKEYKKYLAFHFTNKIEDSNFQADPCLAASSVDFEQSHVRFVLSDSSGMGKSLYIKRLAEKHTSAQYVIIPLHGPVVTPDTVLELFDEHAKNKTCCIYHIDIAPSVLWQVDTILFSLLILRGLCDSQGRVWRCHPNQLYAIEVTLPARNNSEHNVFLFPERQTISLIHLMPSTMCLSPGTALEAGSSSNLMVLTDSKIFRSNPYQRVYQYIRRYRAGKNLDKFRFDYATEGSISDCLEVLLEYCGVDDPSWSELRNFVRFLNLQLMSCQESVYTRQEDVLAGFKGFVVKFMIRMSKDFSISSLHNDMSKDDAQDYDINKYQISKRKQWEQSAHPYIFFNEDRKSITFVGFTVTEDGDLINPVNSKVLEHAIMTPKLYRGLLHNKVNFNYDYKNWKRPDLISSISKVMGLKDALDPDTSYVLTYDNIIKILAIQMRFRCGIPVVIMGETGCGKTRLIRYMCDLAKHGKQGNNMLILKVHGGTTDEVICRFINYAEEISKENKKKGLDTVVFFDEANTTDAIGLIKEVMCDCRINGKPVSHDLKFIAACNPYRKHSHMMIKRLESAGLGFFIQATETQHKLGKIPLRHLVYRVLDLPPSMRHLVYDFGRLNIETESHYTRQIVHDHILIHPQLGERLNELLQPITDVLTYSQEYMRQTQDECSFVSLRDVKRAMIVFEYLYGMMDIFGPLMDKYATGEEMLIDSNERKYVDYESPGAAARALVLSLNVCYDARLFKRSEYEEGVVKLFKGPIELVHGVNQFRDEIRWCQEVLLDNMLLGDNIARNAALRENVFMMTICVELKIPLFLVGKPGSSKSLAKSIVTESLKGKHSKKDLLKNFKEVQMFSYQCSQLSTPESVIEVFNMALKWQAKQDVKSYVALVVLDEVGLAEDAPNMPLKPLHPLLEDGTEGAKKDFVDEILSRKERVAFIGISNWALDPAKMNRGVMVTRADPSEDELVFSAKGICSNKKDDPIRKMLEMYFEPFSKAYTSVCNKQEREFFGLRDFYSLIKMLYSICQESKDFPTSAQLDHAIKRNFDGFETDEFNPFEEFKSVIPKYRPINLKNIPMKLHPIVNPDCSRLGLIKSSLSPQRETWHGKNRYVLFLTENYAALDILKNPTNYLDEELSISQTKEGSKAPLEPFILFGSSFPKDKEYTQVCRNINQIKVCMKTGRTVILLNLEHLYESLYDLLNQSYVDDNYVHLGLQNHRLMCRVDEKFRLILIAEKDTVYEKFPTPLINRLEKHFILISSVLKEWQKDLLKKFEDWVNIFCKHSDSEVKFKQTDAFIGFQKDTPASVIFQASNLLKSATAAVRAGVNVVGGKWERIFQWSNVEKSFWNMTEEQNHETWKEAVLNLSKYFLLQTASPDAIVRLERTDMDPDNESLKIYFERQHHESIDDFLHYHVHDGQREGLLMQLTTSSHLLSKIELKDLETRVKMKTASFFLHEFDTESDFTKEVGLMFKRSEVNDGRCLVIVQCDSGHLHGDLIACARHRIYDLRAKADKMLATHVLFIVHLPQQVSSSSFVSFQGDPWISSHIDDLRQPSDTVVSTKEAITMTISEVFLGQKLFELSINKQPHEKLHPLRSPLFNRLHTCIQAAASRLKDSSIKRSTKRVEILVHLIPNDYPIVLDTTQFHGLLIIHIFKVLQERKEGGREWVIKEAMNPRSLQHGGTFRNALSRKVDEVVIPIFSEIIASIDQNFNLDLIDPKNSNPSRTLFWINMFRIIQFNYADMLAPREQVPGIGGRKAGEDYKCELPFSWLVHEIIDSQWNNAKSTAGDGKHDLHKQLYEAVEPTTVGGVLGNVDIHDSEDFYIRYLHDFVRLVHRTEHSEAKNKTKEYELLSSALDALVHGGRYCSMDGNVTLLHRIAALHVVYEHNKSQILWFGQLVALSPEVIIHLYEDSISHREEMILHFCVAKKALKNLHILLDKDDPENNFILWLHELHATQNAINSIINMPSKNDIKVELREEWDVIKCLQLFLENVLLENWFRHSVSFFNRLNLCLKKNRKFVMAETLIALKNQLSQISNEVKKKRFLKDKKLRSFQQACHNYFMEVVSTFCFGGQTTPEPELIKSLMKMLTEENDLLSPITEIGRSKGDKVSVVKSSLLQLLMEHNFDDVKIHLEEYFLEAFQGKFDENMCLLCIQCFEDAFYKRKVEISKLRKAIDLDKLKLSHNVLQKSDYHGHPTITISYLEAIAHIRFIVTEIVDLFMAGSFTMKTHLLEQLESVCKDKIVNTTDFTAGGDAIGPAVYLLKVFVRQHGLHSLNKAFQQFQWIIPNGLCEAEQEKVVDPFVMYDSDNGYSVMRDALKEEIYSKEVHRLTETTKNCDIRKAAVYLLAMYRAVTFGYPQLMDANVLKIFRQSTLNVKDLTPFMVNIAEKLLTNSQGGRLAEMKVSPGQPPECRIVGSIVVHTLAVLSANTENPILHPFINMLMKPAALADSFLPTMSEEKRKEEEKVIYECTEGHPYIGESEMPVEEELACEQCDANIIKKDQIANVQTGYTLNSYRDAPLNPERNLLPAAICIVRAIMHSAFLWCSCHCQDLVAADLVALVHSKVQVTPDNLPNFFWKNLQMDVEHLSKVTQLTLEESAVIIHLVLHDILTKVPHETIHMATKYSLEDGNDREEWEEEFSKLYIEPIIHRELKTQVTEVMNVVEKDYQQGHNQLLGIAYEKLPVSQDSIRPHLWSYRQRITLEHLEQTLSEAKLKDKYPILHEFLRMEPSLRATQYLPDIVKLQRSLYDTFHLRSDRRKADEKKTIGQFLKEFDNSRKYGGKFDSLQKAWVLVRNEVKSHTGVPLSEEYCLPAITKDMPLEYLIPTTTGAGALTVCLVDYLILVHNNFIEKCTSEVLEEIKSSWDRYKIPIAHVHRCHLLNYEHRIVSVVLSHCCYSLRVGEAHTVQYDHQALEKHILDKFIHGKPRILRDEAQVVCRDTSTVTFDVLRKKINPQVRLEPRVQKEILSDQNGSKHLRENLDVVDIVICFLSSGGGKPDKPLGDYIDRVLKMKKRLSSQKIRRYCELQHILSLWEVLSVELAKQACENKQEPFDMKSKCLDLEKEQVATLEKCLKKLDDLDRLLGALLEFIQIYVKHLPQSEMEEHLLKDTILQEKFEHLDVKAQLSEFPNTITLCQTVAVWKHIAKYQKNLKT